MHAGKHEISLAMSICANEHGGYLPLPSNDQENSDYFRAFQELKGGNAWGWVSVPLDLTDRDTEGTFVRISNGEQPSYTNWATLANEPNNDDNNDLGQEDYVFMLMVPNALQSTWFDIFDNQRAEVICETDTI